MAMTQAREALKHDRRGRRERHCRAGRDLRQSARYFARGARAARQHAHLGRQSAAGCGGLPAIDRGCAAGGAAVRGRARADDRLRRRHFARGPGQCAARRRLARFPRHEPRARRARRGSRLRRRARHHPQAAQHRAARPRRVLSDRSRRRRLARRHGGDARVGHQRGALRHDEGQCAGAQGRARQWRGDVDRAAGEEVLGRLRSHPAHCRLGRHARHHHRADAAACRHPGSDLCWRLSVPLGRGGVQRDDPDHPVRHPGGADRASRYAAGARLQRLFEAQPAGDAGTVPRVSRQRGERRRAVAALRRDRRGIGRRTVRLGDARRGSHPAVAGAA